MNVPLLYAITSMSICMGLGGANTLPESIAPVHAAPRPRQIIWQSHGLEALVHVGVNSFTAKDWGSWTEEPEVFAPTNSDPDQWIAAAKSFGARSLILVTKHHCGFCLWPTAYRLIRRGTVEIVYDHEGNRIRKTTASGTVNYLVDTQNLTGYAQVIAEYNSGSSDPLRIYAYGLDLISQRIHQTVPQPGYITYYYGYDGHGSVRLMIAEDGTEARHYDYDAFGVIISAGGSDVENSYLYAGEQWDSDLGMYFLRARYYDAKEGRFWTMDVYEGSYYDIL